MILLVDHEFHLKLPVTTCYPSFLIINITNEPAERQIACITIRKSAYFHLNTRKITRLK